MIKEDRSGLLFALRILDNHVVGIALFAAGAAGK